MSDQQEVAAGREESYLLLWLSDRVPCSPFPWSTPGAETYAGKIDSEIEVGKCHFILDKGFTWERFYKDHPMAFCVGCDQDEKRHVASLFGELGFQIWNGRTASNQRIYCTQPGIHQPIRKRCVSSSQGSFRALGLSALDLAALLPCNRIQVALYDTRTTISPNQRSVLSWLFGE